MSENNNYQEPKVHEALVPKHDAKILALVVVLVLLALYVAITINENKGGSVFNPVAISEPIQTEATASADGSIRTDLGSAIPQPLSGFMSSTTPQEVSESYTLTYPEGEQSTVTYNEDIAPQVIYAHYLSQLKNVSWILLNTTESDTISSIYGRKNNVDLNILITPGEENEGGSHVTVSMFTI